MKSTNLFLNNTIKYLLVTLLLIVLLYLGKTLFIPLFYGLFIAIVMYPVCRWLERHRFSKSAAIALSLFIVLLLFTLLVWLFILQFNALRANFPLLKEKFIPAINDLQAWAAGSLNLPVEVQQDWWKNATKDLSGKVPSLLSGFLSNSVTGFFMLLIAPIFTALFLYNRSDFVLLLQKLAGEQHRHKLQHVLQNTISTYFNFVKGMTLVYLIVGILNSVGLLILGIEHAFLFGFLTAIMTIIPYIGIAVSALLPITVAWITKDSILYPVAVVAIFAFVQYLEANIIFPKIVGKQLNISTFITLVAVIAGGILWGVNGMILFIPLIAILKLVTDDIPELEAINIFIRRKAE